MASSLSPGFTEYFGTLTDDMYRVTDFLPWPDFEETLEWLADAVGALQGAVDAGRLTAETIEQLLVEEPLTYEIFKELLAAPYGVGFADRRSIPHGLPSDTRRRSRLARLLDEVGLGDLVPERSNVRQLLTVALVGRDSRRRGFRRRNSISEQVDELIADAVGLASEDLDEELDIAAASTLKAVSLPNVRHLIVSRGRPVAAVATIFAPQGGGRQTRAIDGLVNSQRDLSSVPAALIAIADGAGVRDSRSALLRAWAAVSALMSLEQARHGMLAEAIKAAVSGRGLNEGAAVSVFELISARLRDERRVAADDLPLSEDAAELELARYVSDHPDQALRLATADGSTFLTWERERDMSAVSRLSARFDPAFAVEVTASVVGARMEPSRANGLAVGHITAFAHPALPSDFAMFSATEDVSTELVDAVAQQARAVAPSATIGILIVPDAGLWPESPEQTALNRTAVTNVVVLGVRHLETIAGARDPRAALAVRVLRQVDLTKTSPFVFNGVTPSRIYTGRQAEQALVINAIASNSVAVLGSRRIGKTSLLRRVEEALQRQGRTVYYADCEAIGDWIGLARQARRLWGAEIATDVPFQPDLVSELIGQLTRDDSPVVILDEVDRLVEWDAREFVAGVNEPFFRQLRSLSQDQRAQFIFSGERTIAERMWSPDSPHFNFCQRLDLRQLDAQSAETLLFDVLGDLGVGFDEPEDSRALVWSATTGHPRMVQLIGDRLVRTLNGREPDERAKLSLSDFRSVVESLDYKREYLETYWGQATDFERRITHEIVSGERDLSALSARLEVAVEDPAFLRALRMLELYGILDLEESEIELRAGYFPTALDLAARKD